MSKSLYFMEYVKNSIHKSNLSCINRNMLKYLVIVLMVLDHIAYFMVPDEPLTFSFQFVSRLTALIMCFFIAEGYFYTRNVKAYMKRLLLFSIISYVPYSLAFTGHAVPIFTVPGHFVPHYGVILNGFVSQIAYYAYLNVYHSTLVIVENSMIFTLLLGLVSIYIWDRMEVPVWLKVLMTLVIMYLASFSDYSYFAVLYCLIFYFLKNRPTLKWAAFTVVSLLYIFNVCLIDPFTFTWTFGFDAFKVGVFLTPLLLLFYNGEAGKKSGFHKWFFYVFYPGHLLIIGIIGVLIGAYA